MPAKHVNQGLTPNVFPRDGPLVWMQGVIVRHGIGNWQNGNGNALLRRAGCWADIKAIQYHEILDLTNCFTELDWYSYRFLVRLTRTIQCPLNLQLPPSPRHQLPQRPQNTSSLTAKMLPAVKNQLL